MINRVAGLKVKAAEEKAAKAAAYKAAPTKNYSYPPAKPMTPSNIPADHSTVGAIEESGFASHIIPGLGEVYEDIISREYFMMDGQPATGSEETVIENYLNAQS
jgi:hypothetical protein